MRTLAGAALLWALALPASGQAVTDRGPNLDDGWVGAAGVLHFHFMHRFDVAETPDHKVSNSPTFLFAVGLPFDVLAGSRYATNSRLVNAQPNEWELFARWSPLRHERGAPVDVAAEAAFNQTAGSVDGELTLARSIGPLQVIGAARAFSAHADSVGRFAVAGGAVVRLHRYLSIAGDIALPLDRVAGEDPAWSAGLHLAIPYTPHSLSLHVSNANTTTLQGATVGGGDPRWGFEFTVPLTLSRYVTAFAGGDGEQAAAGAATGARGDTVVVQMTNTLRFVPDTLRVRTGQTVVWRNGSDILHTVTADPERAAVAANVRLPAGAAPFDSGDLEPGQSFAHQFDVAGEYRYVCLPHERAGMVGVVVASP